jgi:hypothetical protein
MESIGEGQITITLSRDELRILQNALNEALEAVARSEITSRLGATFEEVKSVQEALRNIRLSS